MKVLLDILNSEKTNIGKLELVKQLEEKLLHEKNIRYINILNLILDVIKTKPTLGKKSIKRFIPWKNIKQFIG